MLILIISGNNHRYTYYRTPSHSSEECLGPLPLSLGSGTGYETLRFRKLYVFKNGAELAPVSLSVNDIVMTQNSS